MNATPSAAAKGYRLAVLSRFVAAALGGYALATTLPILLSHVMPLAKAQAVQVGVLLSFPIYVGAVLWAFATRSAARAWGGLVIPAVICAVLWWVIA